jgi:ubiquinone/menaquinone biosynthesis C-methylase UbiE
MQRTPEPEELMNGPEQALAYARADFSEANGLFITLLEQQLAGKEPAGRLLDLGCGPADIPVDLARRHPALRIDAVDGAQAMLDLAAEKIGADPEIGPRIRLLCEFLPCPTLEQAGYAFVVSNSLLHHLADPAVMWQTILECAQPGAHVLVMDLARPPSEVAVEALVESYAIGEPEVLREDFRNSLFAAYTPSEVAAQLQAQGLDGLQVAMVSDRHLAVQGQMPS